MKELINKIIQMLHGMPRTVQIVISVLIAALLALILLFSVPSCSAIRITGSDGSTSVKVTQSALDSAKVSIHYEPR